MRVIRMLLGSLKTLLSLLRNVFRRRLRIALLIIPPGDIHEERFMTRLHVGYQRTLIALPHTVTETEAVVENASWSVSDDTVLRIDIEQDNPLACRVTGIKPGSATVDFAADAILGEGERLLFAKADFEVIPAEADHIELEIGDETPA